MPPLDPDTIDVTLPEHDGYPPEAEEQDTDEAVFAAFGDAGREFPDSFNVPEDEWEERIEEMWAKKLWPINYLDRYSHQGNSDECTCHSLAYACEMVWNRQRRYPHGDGPEANVRLDSSALGSSVWFSPISVYAQANPRQWGGANIQTVIGIAIDRGILPSTIQPKDYQFKHTMVTTCGGHSGTNQEDGSWPGWSSSDFRRHPDEWPDRQWRETAINFRPLECVNPRSTSQVVSLLLNGCPVGVGRSGHAVTYACIKRDRGRLYYGYPDSYNVTRWDSRAAYSGSWSIVSFTSPDDWDNPSG